MVSTFQSSISKPNKGLCTRKLNIGTLGMHIVTSVKKGTVIPPRCTVPTVKYYKDTFNTRQTFSSDGLCIEENPQYECVVPRVKAPKCTKLVGSVTRFRAV